MRTPFILRYQKIPQPTTLQFQNTWCRAPFWGKKVIVWRVINAISLIISTQGISNLIINEYNDPFLQTNFAPVSHLSTVNKLSSISPVQQPPFHAAPNGHSYKMARTPLGSNKQKYPQYYDENLILQIPVRITRRDELPVKSFNDAPRSSHSNLLQVIPKAHQIQNPKRSSSIKCDKCFKLLSLNARSLKNKSSIFVDYVCDVRPELVAVTETWFNDKDTAARIDCSPPGYRLLDCHRTDSRGGGTALFYQENIPVEKVSAAILNSFEYSEWKICPFGSMMFKLIIIYRPPYSSTHPVSMGTFFNELIEYLE